MNVGAKLNLVIIDQNNSHTDVYSYLLWEILYFLYLLAILVCFIYCFSWDYSDSSYFFFIFD